MVSFKLTAVAALFSLTSAQEQPELFSLQEDKQVIAPTAEQPEKDLFTMEKDTFIPVPEKDETSVDYKKSDENMAE